MPQKHVIICLARAILRSYARNISTLAKKTNMLKDVVANFESVSQSTFDSYLNAFQPSSLFKIYLLGVLLFVQHLLFVAV